MSLRCNTEIASAGQAGGEVAARCSSALIVRVIDGDAEALSARGGAGRGWVRLGARSLL